VNRRRRTTLITGALVLALLTAVAAAVATSKVIARGTQLKGTNVWYAQGKASKPTSLSAEVVPSPSQAVKVQWSVVCQKPNAADPAYHLATKVVSGQTTAHATAVVKLALPYAAPPSCVATVYATLAKRGKLTLQLLQG
jgi:invasion protein IalB